MQKIPQGEGPAHSYQVGLMPVVPGGYKCVLTGIDTYSRLGFAYPLVDTSAQCTMKGSEQKILIVSMTIIPRNTLSSTEQ